MAKLPPQFELKIEKLVFGGEGLGYFEKKPIFVMGVLPGELVKVAPARVTSKFAKAYLVEVLEASPKRIMPKDEHYLITSPWQIMPMDYQLEQKVILAKEVFSKFSQLPLTEVDINHQEPYWSYRNKMEFSFTEDNEKISLAFHQRYSWKRLNKLTESSIAHPLINKVAGEIINELNARKIAISGLKNLLVRYSYVQDKVLAVLYVNKKDFSVFDLSNINNVAGWLIVYSDPKFSVAKTTAVLHQQGDDYLVEEVGGKKFKYFFGSFFQVNPPVFELALNKISNAIEPGKILADLYAGCGIIGFSLADKFEQIWTIESDPLGVQAAENNIRLNGLSNKVQLITGEAEKQDLADLFAKSDTVVLDPPRDGLHPKVLERLLEAKPRQLVYLSCNPATQARDWSRLSEIYQANTWELFDFYPQTPHLESLIIATLGAQKKD